MLRNQLYYAIKPFLPRGFRMGIRSWWSRRLRARTASSWPIMPGSQRPPLGWQGWPEGKKFALVLTHDVEGVTGLEQVRDLMHVEMELGFRSSFNFIPESGYRVSPELRNELVTNGFEVGVHDFHHDGYLFRSRKSFAKKAEGINRTLQEWNAVGFRSGFMFHKLGWMHQLNVEYDASTFDTDPFEPQPEGKNTIFPFWNPLPSGSELPSHGRNGYVELPYTLPQDSTLFLMLREPTPEIWMRKLDWIAEHGGMALLNVHPDYLSFENKGHRNYSYPIEHYRAFLKYVRSTYAGDYWPALPREVSRYIAGMGTKPLHRPQKRIGMVTHSFYESDNRVMRYAESLAERGDSVEVLALRRSADTPREETIKGVSVLRIRDRFEKKEKTKAGFLVPLLRFLWAASRRIRQAHKVLPYDILHIHNVPDFMVFAGWYPKWKGTKIILDIHDIVPEFFASKFGKPTKGGFFTLLLWMERFSAAFADHVIVANHLWLEKYSARTHSSKKSSVFINNVDATLFTPRERTRTDGKLLLLFPGGLYWHQGLDIAVRAMPAVRKQLPNVELHIYGDGDCKQSLQELAAELGLNGTVRFFPPVRIREVAQVMADADVGIVPKRADSFGNEAYSTKIMEFMSVRVPVVASSTAIDRHYFSDSVLRFFESGNVDALAAAILEILTKPDLRAQLVEKAAEYADLNSWSRRRNEYFQLVDSLSPHDAN